jgi:hypothetical protein
VVLSLYIYFIKLEGVNWTFSGLYIWFRGFRLGGIGVVWGLDRNWGNLRFRGFLTVFHSSRVFCKGKCRIAGRDPFGKLRAGSSTAERDSKSESRSYAQDDTSQRRTRVSVPHTSSPHVHLHVFVSTGSSVHVRLYMRWECERFGTDRRILVQYGCVVSLGMLQVLQPGPCTRENRQRNRTHNQTQAEFRSPQGETSRRIP